MKTTVPKPSRPAEAVGRLQLPRAVGRPVARERGKLALGSPRSALGLWSCQLRDAPLHLFAKSLELERAEPLKLGFRNHARGD